MLNKKVKNKVFPRRAMQPFTPKPDHEFEEQIA